MSDPYRDDPYRDYRKADQPSDPVRSNRRADGSNPRDPRRGAGAAPVANRPTPARGRTAGDEPRRRPVRSDVPAAPRGTVRSPAAPPRKRPRRKPQAVSQRGRRTRRDRAARVDHRRRNQVALAVVLTLLAAALGKLITIQTVDAQALATTGLDQKEVTLTLHGERGSITDRNGTPLAFTVEGRAIAARPADFQNDQQRVQVADILVAALGSAVDRATLLKQMRSKNKYVYLARAVMPAMATSIMAKVAKVLSAPKASQKEQNKLINAVVTEAQDIRSTPDGSLAASVVGYTQWDGSKGTSTGMAGIESKFNSLLAGRNGSRTVQIDNTGSAIPNTVTNVTPAVDGTSIRLTLDQDLQYTLNEQLIAQVNASKAKGGCAVVKGIGDGQILAMACYQPGKTPAQTGNLAVTTPFEPGSVNKVVTFAAAIERGLITPTTQFLVDGQISMGGRQIHDAWAHSPVQMTATGILGKSSNVGTLMIAQKVGANTFAAELAKMGLGRKTGIELPGESAGYYPDQANWSATSFANLPIGQGVSMTLLQLVDMYQAIGNKGVMVAPTIIAGTTKNGVYTPAKIKSSTRVMKATTAQTLLDMLRGPIQGGNWYTKGTGTSAAITGYQVAGKTGTAQQVDPTTKAYSQTLTNATFAGIVPADNPKYAIAIMIDAPVNGSEGGDSAAPLFHKIASYALRSADVPPSKTAAPIYNLYVPPTGQ
ncbi:peptidoglycan D,D-transpeptidase FtsI family protein [Nakamurella panacisegetis]|uniref:peptidoglycan D,D-transpeptidase FtsI family protein n=1 Tax=Nakamurella panacisegetis TaxID=1090615 RepID=UPI001560731D|nr:penicillin-binding protein 2 [Nakamurella panacisegetis]